MARRLLGRDRCRWRLVAAAAVRVRVVLEEALELVLHHPRSGRAHHLGMSHRAHLGGDGVGLGRGVGA